MAGKELQRLSEDEWYFGDLADGIYHGIGFKQEIDGSMYYGCWKNGNREGMGMQAEFDGSLVIGEWAANLLVESKLKIWPAEEKHFIMFAGHMDGNRPKEGTLLCTDGKRYTGIFTDWRGNSFDGEGVIFRPNKRLFAGHWKDGNNDVGGVTLNANNPDANLIGTLSNVSKHYIVKSWENDPIKRFFFGDTVDDAKNAEGFLMTTKLDTYEGSIKNSNWNGNGLLWDTANEVRIGNWQNGKLSGLGIYFRFLEDSIECYLGNFNNSVFDGEGALFKRDQNGWSTDYVEAANKREKAAPVFQFTALDKHEYTYRLKEKCIVIGRENEMHEYLEAKSYVARKQAEIFTDEGKLYIRNLSKTNPTFVNNKVIPDEQYTEIHDGDIIGLGGKKINGFTQREAGYIYVSVLS